MNGGEGRMMNLRQWMVAVLLLGPLAASAGASAPPDQNGLDPARKASYEQQMAALKLKGDVQRGKDIYYVCSSCHLPSGAGRSDGTYPQLAGQHASVVIKQIADIRAGLRDNPPMYPFAITLADPQELADVAAYIQTLCIPRDHGRPPGDGVLLSHGKAVYQERCAACHGQNGQGDAAQFYPVLAGQHYKYLLRQVTAIRDGRRRNGNPAMVGVVKQLSGADLDAVVEYMASLDMPGAMCRPAGSPSK